MLSASDPPPARWLSVRADLLARFAAAAAQATTRPRPSLLRDSIPDVPAAGPPPEVLRAFASLPEGGPWELGATDRTGQRWVHEPWKGWRPASPSPFIHRGRVYTSATARRARRRARARDWLARTVIGAALLLAGALLAAAVTAVVLALALAAPR